MKCIKCLKKPRVKKLLCNRCLLLENISNQMDDFNEYLSIKYFLKSGEIINGNEVWKKHGVSLSDLRKFINREND